MSGPWYYTDLLRAGRLLNVYQPIVDLKSGGTLSVELLTRLIAEDGRIIPPAEFLPKLRRPALENLFFTSLAQARRELAAVDPGIAISINVGPELMLRKNFLRKLLAATAGMAPRRLALEMLEDREFLSLEAAAEQIDRLHEAGIAVAIDDLGAGYSSLARLNQLKVDVIKLDRDFAINLRRRPDSLHVISSMTYLARGLRAQLVVEGVETLEIAATLRTLGVKHAQGYGIARPMPAQRLPDWLASPWQGVASRAPTSMLGAYAAHISIMDAYRALLNQPLGVTFTADVSDPHACPIGQFFDKNGLHDCDFGIDHKRFHRKLACHAEDPRGFEEAGMALWRSLQRAVEAETAAASAGTVKAFA